MTESLPPETKQFLSTITTLAAASVLLPENRDVRQLSMAVSVIPMAFTADRISKGTTDYWPRLLDLLSEWGDRMKIDAEEKGIDLYGPDFPEELKQASMQRTRDRLAARARGEDVID